MDVGVVSMFERYSENAKRVIFFGRYEASRRGSREIETEHLLLGLFRVDRRLARKILGSGGLIKRYISSRSSIESIRRNVDIVGEKIPRPEQLPLSHLSLHVLDYAAKEAELCADRHVSSKHLLLGLLLEDRGLAAKLLNAQGVSLEKTRDKLA